jgi:hypothetical protein
MTAMETSNTCDPKPHCAGLDINKYGTQGTYYTLIEQNFCPGWNPSNGGADETFLQGTPGAVNFNITAPASGQQNLPTGDDCEKNLHAILDGCDTDDNTMNWKADGDIEVDGWTYRISPQSDRPPAPANPAAWCKFQEGEKDGSFTLWGSGWLNSGYGSELKAQLEDQNVGIAFAGGPGYDGGSWNFGYELRDGHEWTVSMGYSLGITPFDIKKLAVEVMTDTADFDGFTVTCEG